MSRARRIMPQTRVARSCANSKAKLAGAANRRTVTIVGSDADTPETEDLVELLYFNTPGRELAAALMARPAKSKPDVKFYTGGLGDFVDTDDSDEVVERLTDKVTAYLAGTAAQRRKVMSDHLEVFVITDPNHPAKRRTDDVLKWIEVRPIERGLRAKKALKQFQVLGEYCGVVKTLAQSEVDAAAACAADERLTGYIIKDKTESFDTEIDLPEGHWASGNEIVIDAAKARNCLALINDAHGFPGDGKTPNVASFQIFDRATGELHLFFLTTCSVAKGDELLLDYGKSFWENMESKVAWAQKTAADRREIAKLKAQLSELEGAKELADNEAERCLDAEERLRGQDTEMRRVQAEREAAIASMRAQLGRAHRQDAELQRCRGALQQKAAELGRLRASHAKDSALTGNHVATAEAELREMERKHEALAAACEGHARNEAELAHQLAQHRASSQEAACMSAHLAAAAEQKDQRIAELQAAQERLTEQLASAQYVVMSLPLPPPPPLPRPPPNSGRSNGSVWHAAPAPHTAGICPAIKPDPGATNNGPPESAESHFNVNLLITRLGRAIGTPQTPSKPCLPEQNPVEVAPAMVPASFKRNIQAAVDRGRQRVIAPALPTFADLANDFNSNAPHYMQAVKRAPWSPDAQVTSKLRVNVKNEKEEGRVAARSHQASCCLRDGPRIKPEKPGESAGPGKARKAHDDYSGQQSYAGGGFHGRDRSPRRRSGRSRLSRISSHGCACTAVKHSRKSGKWHTAVYYRARDGGHRWAGCGDRRRSLERVCYRYRVTDDRRSPSPVRSRSRTRGRGGGRGRARSRTHSRGGNGRHNIYIPSPTVSSMSPNRSSSRGRSREDAAGSINCSRSSSKGHKAGNSHACSRSRNRSRSRSSRRSSYGSFGKRGRPNMACPIKIELGIHAAGPVAP